MSVATSLSPLAPPQVSSAVASRDLLAAIAGGLAASLSDVHTDPATDREWTGGERTWEQLLATDAYDAWLIRWPAGTSVGPHDHGGSSGAFAVVSGTLVEVTAELAGTRVAVHATGSTRAFAADVVHDVANAGPDAAVSVHVYAPPLTTMRRYVWAPAGTEAA